MVRLFPKSSGPSRCVVCGAMHSSCSSEEEATPGDYPEVIDQRFGAPWRFRSRREVRRAMGDGRMIVVWPKGMPIPPEEALRQGIVKFDELTPREKARVDNYLERQKRAREAIVR